MIDYITYHAQPLSGLVLGSIVILMSAYLYSKVDKKVKAESTLPITSRSMINSILRVILSFGIAIGGIMIILAIKFLSS